MIVKKIMGQLVLKTLLIMAVLLAITFALWRGLKAQENNAITDAVSQELDWGKETIVNQINLYLVISQHVAERWAFYGSGHRDEWEYDAQYNMDVSPGWLATGWVDESYNTRYRVSSSSKELIEDFGSFLKENQASVIEAAKQSHFPQLSGIIHPKQGGERTFLVTPIFVENQFQGVIVDIFDVNLILNTVLKTSIDDGWVYLLKTGKNEIRLADVGVTPRGEKWSQETALQVPGVSATLKVTPGPTVLARLGSKLSEIVLLSGLMLTGMFTWGAWSAQVVKVKADELQRATVLLRQLREAMDSSAIVSMTDVRGIITYANDNFCAISGYSREELLGQNHRIIKSGLHPKEYYTDMWHTVAQGKVWKGEICNKAKDGSLYWVFATIFPFLGEDGKPESYMGIRHDITDRKRIEVELAEQAKELRRSNRALGEFDHVVAHELKTPLTVIKMAAENLTGAGLGPLNSIQESVVGMIDKNVNHLASIINGLLKIAQFGSGGGGEILRNLDPKRHADIVIQHLQTVAQEKNVELRGAIPEGCPHVKSSPEVFAEILTNLMGNAVRYASREVVLEAQSVSGKVQFGVRDDGPGIPKEQHSKIFEKFSSDKKLHTPLFRGSGLGLYICKDLVEYMGGKIWVESEEGKGTCFYFTLPIGEPESPTTAA